MLDVRGPGDTRMSRFKSVQDEVRRVRASRVEITHAVHLPNGTTTQESLPLILGVIADLAGDAEGPRESLRDASRDFVRVHKDNFDEVLAGHKPRLGFDVADTLREQGQIKVNLEFRRLTDFHPDAVAQQVPELRDQLRTRKLLEEMRNLLSSRPDLEEQLAEIVSDPAKRAQLLDEVARRRDAVRHEER